MDCAAFKEHAGLFALGSLGHEEHAPCSEHLAALETHDGCIEALREAMAGVSALDEVPPPPPAHVWQALEARLPRDGPRLRVVQRRSWAALSVALAAGVAALFLESRVQHLEAQLEEARRTSAVEEQAILAATAARDHCREEVLRLGTSAQLESGAVALLELPGTQLFPLKTSKEQATGRAAANAILHTGIKRAYVVAEGLSAVPDHDYEMWVAKGSRVVAAGVMTVDNQGRALMRVDYASLLGDTGAPDAMMITLEPHAGDLQKPGPTVLFGKPRA
jgi:hypothetical protein